jgi:hypothetical protein
MTSFYPFCMKGYPPHFTDKREAATDVTHWEVVRPSPLNLFDVQAPVLPSLGSFDTKGWMPSGNLMHPRNVASDGGRVLPVFCSHLANVLRTLRYEAQAEASPAVLRVPWPEFSHLMAFPEPGNLGLRWAPPPFRPNCFSGGWEN